MTSTTVPTRAERATAMAFSTLRSRTTRAVAVTFFVGLLVVDGFDALTDPPGRYLNGLTFTCVVGVIAVLLALPRVWMVAAGALSAVAVWLLMVVSLQQVPDVYDPPTPVSAAVGGSAYYGTPYIPDQVAVALVGLAALGLALVLFIAARVREKRGDAVVEVAAEITAAEPDDAGPPSRREAIVAIAGVAIAALLILPLLGTSVVDNYRGAPLLWDGQNLVAWEHAIQRGLTPMKDFFWPYGETWIFYRYPEGIVFAWFSQVATLALAGWAVWRLSPAEGRAARVIAVVLMLSVLGTWTPFTWRYSLSILMVLVYVACGPLQRDRPDRRLLLLFGLTTVMVAFYELNSMVIGLAGCALAAFVAVISGHAPRAPKTLVRRALVDFTPAVAALVLLFLAWVIQGSVTGNLRWWLGTRATSADSAPDEIVAGALLKGITAEPTYEMALIGMPLVLLVAGLWLAWGADRLRSSVAQLTVGGAGVSLFLVSKHLVRPQGDLIFISLIVTLLFVTVLLWNPRRMILSIACGAFLGMTIYSVQQVKAVTNYWSVARHAPQRALDSAQFAANGTERVNKSAARFKVETYPGWTPEPGMAAALQAARNGLPDKSFAVLGDAQGVYFLLDQPAPWHTQLYNAGPIEEEEAMVDALEKEDPAVILWRKDFVIDGVPQTVRTPLVMNYVIENYAPRPLNGPSVPSPIDILVKRPPGQPVSLAYWKSQLGDTVDLGYVPSASSADDEDSCSGGDDCVRYAIVEKKDGEAPVRGRKIVLRVAGPNGTFFVTMRGDPDEREYPVRLDRLWFYRYLGDPVTVTTDTAGFTVRDAQVKAGDDLF